jgi:hypothetical protein
VRRFSGQHVPIRMASRLERPNNRAAFSRPASRASLCATGGRDGGSDLRPSQACRVRNRVSRLKFVFGISSVVATNEFARCKIVGCMF